jgi:hypothetical protein
MPDIRIKDLSTEQTDLTGFIETDDATLGSRKLNLSQLAARLAARAPLDYIQMDGATTNRAAGIYGPFDATVNRRGWIAGVPVLTVLFDFVVPTSNPSVEASIYHAGSSTTVTAALNTFRFIFGTTGALVIDQISTISPFAIRRFTWAGFRTTYSGQSVRGRLQVTKGTGAVVLEINGVDVSSSLVAGDVGTGIPEWLDATMSPTHHVVGLNWAAPAAPTVIPILGTLTTAEADTWRLDGRLPGWVQAGGSPVTIITSNGNLETSGASAGITGTNDFNNWWKGSALTIAVETVDVPAGSTKAARLTGAGSLGATSSNWFRPNLASNVQDPAVLTTSAYGYRFKAKYVSGGNLFAGQGFADTRTITPAEAADWTEFTGIFAPALTGGKISAINFGAATGAVWLIDDVQVWRGGALTIPVVQPALVVGDGTLIGDNCGRILGGLPVTSRDRWRIVGRTHTSAAQDVQLLGGPIFLETNRSRIDSACAVQNSGGALNIAVGSTSGGTNIVASTEIATGSVPTELAPALRYPPTQNLFIRRVAGSGTGPFTITLDGHRVAGNP